MKRTTESSFGARLRRAQDILAYIQNFAGYAPPRTQESVAGFTTLLGSIVTSNATASSDKEQYTVAVNQRQLAFRGPATSISKLLFPLRGAVEAKFGKKSIEMTSLNVILRTMRSQKLVKPPSAASAGDGTEKSEKHISRSELSFGSMTQHFNDLVAAMSQFTGYNPANPTFKMNGLQALSAQLHTLNNAVAQKTQILKTTRSSRLLLYEDLHERVERIKSHVRSQYGTLSNEYALVRGITA